MEKDLSQLAGRYDLIYADPPWPMWGDPNKNAAAGKHYDLMTLDQIKQMPIKSLFRDKGALFLWATCPRLDIAMDTIKAWGMHYRGIAFIWVKTRKDGEIIHGQGVPPTATKPTSEVCLLATTNKQGRPFPLTSHNTPQVILHPRGRHSQKPSTIRRHIEQLYGDRPKIELFARQSSNGWDGWGNEFPGEEAKEEEQGKRMEARG